MEHMINPLRKRSSWLGFFSGHFDHSGHLCNTSCSPALFTDGHPHGFPVYYVLAYPDAGSKLNPWSAGSKTMRINKQTRKAIIVAGEEEAGRIRELINRSKDHIEVLGTVIT